MLGKYKYYFKKPKSEIVKDILLLLLVSGALSLGGGAVIPYRYFLPNFLRQYPRFKKYPTRKLSSAFWRLKKQGVIRFYVRNHQVYIKLTKEGKKKAGIFQIDTLKINRPRKWDRKWRILIFDIGNLKKLHREALRGKLKELGFLKLQKSVWIHPFDCSSEVALIKDFFGFSESEMRLIVAEHIGNDSELRKHFRI
jgi:hypothetical protein